MTNCISFAKYQNESATGKNFKERGFPDGTVVKNPPANTRDAGDQDLIPGSGRSPGVGNGYTPVFLPGKSHGQRTFGGLQSMGSQRVEHE